MADAWCAHCDRLVPIERMCWVDTPDADGFDTYACADCAAELVGTWPCERCHAEVPITALRDVDSSHLVCEGCARVLCGEIPGATVGGITLKLIRPAWQGQRKRSRRRA